MRRASDEFERRVRYLEESYGALIAMSIADTQRLLKEFTNAMRLEYDMYRAEVLAPATPPPPLPPAPPKEKEEEDSLSASLDGGVVEDIDSDDDDDDDDDDDNEYHDSFEVADNDKEALRTYSTKKKPAPSPRITGRKRARTAPQRFRPESIEKARKNDREADRDSKALVPRATRHDTRELDRVHELLLKYPGDVHYVSAHSRWFRSRYGMPLNNMAAALGREGDSQKQRIASIFDVVCHDALLDMDTTPRVEGPVTVVHTRCCVCGIVNKPCTSLLFVHNDTRGQYMGSACAAFVSALIAFFAALRDGEPVTELDAIFARVMKAHADKGGSGRADNKRSKR